MKTYTVKYKSIYGWVWCKIKNVKGDAISECKNWKIFITEDECQYHFPVDQYVFIYSKERYDSIQERMNQEAGQVVNIRRR